MFLVLKHDGRWFEVSDGYHRLWTVVVFLTQLLLHLEHLGTLALLTGYQFLHDALADHFSEVAICGLRRSGSRGRGWGEHGRG